MDVNVNDNVEHQFIESVLPQYRASDALSTQYTRAQSIRGVRMLMRYTNLHCIALHYPL